MAGERKKLASKAPTDAMAAARQAYLKENLPKAANAQDEPAENPEASAPEHEESVVDEPRHVDREYTEVEREAMALGWAPEEEWTSDKSKWRDAKSWIDNTKIARELSETKKVNAQILDYLKSIKEEKSQSTINELKQKKREYIAAGDVDAVEKIDAQIEKMFVKPVQDSVATNNPPEVDDFLRRNEWFHTDREMKKFMIDREQSYVNLYPEMSVAERIRRAEADTLRFYNKTPQANIPTVEPRRGSAPRSIEPEYDALDAIVKGVVDHEVKTSLFRSKRNKNAKPITREQSIARLYRSGAIDKYGKVI